MAKIKMTAVITGQRALADGIFDMRIKAPRIAAEAVPGQFASLYSGDGARLLPRPISLCGIDREQGELRLVYRVAGQGTAEFSRLGPGDAIEVMGPLGNGFPIMPGKRILLIGGGIGIPPMLELGKALNQANTLNRANMLNQDNVLNRANTVNQTNALNRANTVNQANALNRANTLNQDNAAAQPGSVCSVLGYRDASLFLKEEFEAYGPVYTATEDGSRGTKGNVLDAIREHGLGGDIMYACGPTPMLRALKAWAGENGIRCWLSMEEKMACGVGACLACVCGSKDIDSHSQVHNKRVCKDGPVFAAEEIEL